MQNRALILVALLLAAFAINLDTTIVNVALPTLVRELHASNSQLQWIVDAYNLVFAALLLACGSLSDRFGRKGMLLSGLAVFGLASAAGGLMTSTGGLIAARCVMGLGAAMVFPATLSLISNIFVERGERARAIGLWGATAGDRDRARADRRRLAAGALQLVEHLLRDDARGGPRRGARRPLRADLAGPRGATARRPGFALSTTAMAALIFTLIEAPEHGWSSPRSWSASPWRRCCSARSSPGSGTPTSRCSTCACSPTPASPPRAAR